MDQLSPLQQAFLALKETQAKLDVLEKSRSEPIAVIGVGCRFPGRADNPAAFWQLLSRGVDAVQEVPSDRWDIDDYYDPDPSAPGKMSTRWGGFLEQVYDFDADFFGISPREAVRVDPQQRLLLEVTWEALEDAGLPPTQIAQSSTGVYVGVLGSDHILIQSRDPNDVDVFSGTGLSHAILANRLSYVLNLHGPSLTLDTACSSSLVTVHLACQSLRRGESNLALAGGVNLILSPEMSIALSKAHMMAPDGRCKTFDASADGYVRGEGCGMLVMKRLSEAQADGDRIIAVIRGTAVNHDGRSNGLSAPNGLAQEQVIRAALADSNLAPDTIGYVEAHGSGTRLGDPIEIEALCSVLGANRAEDQPLLVGSVKTNIGHLESAAGIAGLIKTILMLKNRRIPPHLHVKTVNPLLKIDETPIKIPTQSRPWPRGHRPRRAGVSSFGFGGTNSHAIVEEAPARELSPNDVERSRHLLAFSARSSQALSELAGRYADHLGADLADSLPDIAFTANTGRMHFTHRAAVVADSREGLRDKLRTFDADGDAPSVRYGNTEHSQQPRVAFLFTGQGAQYTGMGRVLYETQPTFKAALDECAEHLQAYLDRPLLSLLDPQAGSHLDQTGYTQPAMFALEYALAALWRSWGVEPAAVMGHSVGEYVAACVAGVFGLEDGLKLISERARLMQALPSGGMMAAVFASYEEVESAIAKYTDQVTIAALNGPRNIVISGVGPAVGRVLEELEANAVKSKILATSHAFHSHLMDPMLGELEWIAESVQCSTPKIDIISNLTGQLADEGTYAEARYWTRHARCPVRFAEGMRTLAARDCDVFLEIGPSPTLVGMGRGCLSDGGHLWLPSLRRGVDDWQTMLGSLANLYTHGVAVDWAGFDRDYRRRRTELPTYPFQRRCHRRHSDVSSSVPPAKQIAGRLLHPLLGRRLLAAVSDHVFESQLGASQPAVLGDHRVHNRVIMPGAAFLEMALAASAEIHETPWNVASASFVEPLLLEQSPQTIQTILTPEGPDTASFRIVSVTESGAESEPRFVTHAFGQLEATSKFDGDRLIDLDHSRQQYAGEPYDDEWRAQALRKSGLEPGPAFCWTTAHWLNGREAFGEIRAASESDHADEYQIHPGLLDTGFQILSATLLGAGATGTEAFVPIGVDELRLYDRPRGVTFYLASLKSLESGVATGDIRLVDATGRLLMEIQGIRMRQVPRDWLDRFATEPEPDWTYELSWKSQALEAASEADTLIEPGRWLILQTSGELGVGVELAERLEMKGHRCQLAEVDGPAGTRAESVEQFLSSGNGPCRGIVCLTGVAAETTQSPSIEPCIAKEQCRLPGRPAHEAEGSSATITGIGGTNKPDFEAERQHGWGAVLAVVHALTSSDVAEPPRLWLVTRGAHAVGNRPLPLQLGQAPIWGLARVIAAEHPELACTRIDLDPEDSRGQADHLVEEILSGLREDQVAYRAGDRCVARLRRPHRGTDESVDVPHGQPYRLEITSRGQLDSVVLQPTIRQKPGPGQVEIRVRATGLNFRDVLNVLGLYPGDAGPLGGECAGEIVAVGEGVENLKPGDEVVALGPASFASFVTTLAEFAVAKPKQLSFQEGAALPICFATAHHALCRLGAMQPGERVLIHAASGGVGMAAIQIAKQLEVEILATAGSPRKRDFLRSLGIEHVMDSRSLDFADQTMKATDGQGVDLVLNSLTGETIGASLSVLRAGGRFMELGKTDLWDQQRVDQVKPGVRFHAIALDQMMAEEPETVGQLMREVVSQFVEKTLEPPPVRTFPIARVVSALRHMAKAEHIGKVVIEAAEEEWDREFSLSPDGTYVVTGGLGGLGLLVARWIADRGARYIVLVGRSEATEQAHTLLDELEQSGVHVEVKRCDVSRREEVAALVSDIDEALPQLVGVFHLAGVLDDGTLREQTPERFDRVMAAKVQGAWNLHELTSDRTLDCFVLFSSAASLLGPPGQGNYAAANAFLDALAHHRRWQGKTALSVNWGSWAEVGMAARMNGSQGSRWSAAGIGWIEPARGLETLERLMAEDHTQVGVLPIDWSRFLERFPPGTEPPWLSDIASELRDTAPPTDGGPPALLEKLESVTPGERLEVALTYMRQQAARVLAIDDTVLPDPQRPLNELGFDSLTAVEFCNRVSRSIGHHLNPTLLFDYSTLQSLAGYVVRDALQLESNAAEEPANVGRQEAIDDFREQAMDDVEAMSEEEMDALVAEQLEKLQQ